MQAGQVAAGQVAAGEVAAGEVAAWWAALRRAGETEMFFAAVLGFIAAGGGV